MKISARNALRGKVKSIKKGGESCEVVIEVAAGVDVVSIVSPDSIAELELAVGKEALAVFKASDTMVGIPHHKRGE
jgi:molybdate transport system regulatory protein